MQIHIILSNFKFVTLMEQNMVVLPEHMVSHTMFEFCHGFAFSNARVSQPVHHNCPVLRSTINLVVTIKQKFVMGDDNKNNPGQ
jgi:hypothetical protein